MQTRAVGGEGLEKLTRRHGVKLNPTVNCSVEDCSLAIGEIVGYDSIKSASRMNNGVVIFLDSVDKVSVIVEQGVVIKDTFVQVLPLVNPAKKIILSKVPPFISNDMLKRELTRHGQLMSPIKLIPLGCKSPHLKHVVSFRRQVFMILKNNTEELNLMLKFRVDDFDYVVYISSETMKCFGCGMEGHLIRSCPSKHADNNGETAAKSAEQSETVAPSTTQENRFTQSSKQDKSQSSKQAEGEFQVAGSDGAVGLDCTGPASAGPSAAGPDGAVGLTAADPDITGQGAVFSVSDGLSVVASDDAGPCGATGPVSVESVTGLGATGSGEAGPGDVAGPFSDVLSVAGSGSTGKGAVVEVIEQSHTDSISCDLGLVQTQAGTQEADYFLEEEAEMLVDEVSSKDKEKKRKTDDICQFSSKSKKVSQDQCLQSDESENEENDDEESLASSQTWARKKGGYSLASIKKFLQDTKGARNVKVEKVFPDLQLFLDSVKTFMRSPGVLGEKAFTDQETFRIKKTSSKGQKAARDR